jgi:NSS family neurotransmitter:Na+ symporter
MDLKIKRRTATLLVTGFAFIAGIPSAVNLNIFQNQDWVWGLGLMLSGLFIAAAAAKYGVKKFRSEYLNHKEAALLGTFFDIWVTVAIPLQFVIMLGWWFKQSIGWEAGWYNPFKTFSVGTAVVQWTIILIILALLNTVLVQKTLKR